MATYDYIIRAMGEYVAKCSHRLTLTEKITNSFNKFHEETCGNKIRKTEKAFITDAEGNPIYEKNGKKDKVEFHKKTLMDLYEEYGELYVTHNHPRFIGKDSKREIAECLSVADISFVLEKYGIPNGHGGMDETFLMKSISCESANGSRMTFTRGDFYKEENNSKVMSIARDLDKAYWNYMDDYYSSEHANLSKYMETMSYEEACQKVDKDFIESKGRFEQTTEFKNLQKQFRDYDCRVEINYPYTYQTNHAVF